MKTRKYCKTWYFFVLRCLAFSGVFITLPVSAAQLGVGSMTLNFDRSALAAAFIHDDDPGRPAFYLEEFFTPGQFENLTDAQLLTRHNVAGTGEIPSTGLQLTINSGILNGRGKPTDFSFDANDIQATASGGIGLGGGFRFRIDVPFRIEDGEEAGNRTIIGDFTLEYDANRATGGHSGWTLFNHVSWRADVFDLDNVLIEQTGDSLQLNAQLALGHGFSHLGGTAGSIIGDISLQAAVVPVPAAVWLFASACLGLLPMAARKGELNA